ncbi:unnamed protein product [Sphagnum tenellum]
MAQSKNCIVNAHQSQESVEVSSFQQEHYSLFLDSLFKRITLTEEAKHILASIGSRSAKVETTDENEGTSTIVTAWMEQDGTITVEERISVIGEGRGGEGGRRGNDQLKRTVRAEQEYENGEGQREELDRKDQTSVGAARAEGGEANLQDLPKGLLYQDGPQGFILTKLANVAFQAGRYEGECGRNAKWDNNGNGKNQTGGKFNKSTYV